MSRARSLASATARVHQPSGLFYTYLVWFRPLFCTIRRPLFEPAMLYLDPYSSQRCCINALTDGAGPNPNRPKHPIIWATRTLYYCNAFSLSLRLVGWLGGRGLPFVIYSTTFFLLSISVAEDVKVYPCTWSSLVSVVILFQISVNHLPFGGWVKLPILWCFHALANGYMMRGCVEWTNLELWGFELFGFRERRLWGLRAWQVPLREQAFIYW